MDLRELLAVSVEAAVLGGKEVNITYYMHIYLCYLLAFSSFAFGFRFEFLNDQSKIPRQSNAKLKKRNCHWFFNFTHFYLKPPVFLHEDISFILCLLYCDIMMIS